MKPKRVYHYTKLETFEQHILPSGSLKFSPAAATNDPVECDCWRSPLPVTDPDPRLLSMIRLHSKKVAATTE